MTVSLESSNQIVEKPTKLSYMSSWFFVPQGADDLVDKCLYFETLSNDAKVSCRCSRVNSIELQTNISKFCGQENKVMCLICARTNWTKYLKSWIFRDLWFADSNERLTNTTLDFQLHACKKGRKMTCRSFGKNQFEKNKSIFLCHISCLALLSFSHQIFVGQFTSLPTCSHLQHNFHVTRSQPVPLTTPTLPAWSYHVSRASITVTNGNAFPS